MCCRFILRATASEITRATLPHGRLLALPNHRGRMRPHGATNGPVQRFIELTER